RRVGVRVDGDSYALRRSRADPAPVHIQPVRIGVQLQRHMMLGTGRDHGFVVYRIAFTGEQEPTRRVAQDGGVRILYRREEALGGFGLGHVELRVDARHDEVEAGQHLVVVVEAAIGQDVALYAAEDAEGRATVAGIRRVEAFDFGLLF